MEFKKIIDIVNQMHEEGIDAYIIKNTVFDIIEQKNSSSVQLAVSTSIRKVAEFFKSHNYEIREQKTEMLYGYIDGTRFGIATLRYITYNEFVDKILKTDFTANTLIMNRNEQVKDLFGAFGHIKEKLLVPVEGFNIRDTNYNYVLYLDIMRKLFKFDFWAKDNGELAALFEYLTKYSNKLSENQKKNIDKQFCDYVLGANDEVLKSNLKIKYFLHIPNLYLKLRCNEVNNEGLNLLMSLPREQFLSVISYLYSTKFDALDYSPVYKAITQYIGEDLNNEEIYDTAIDNWGYEVVDNVMKTKSVLCKLVNQDFKIPSYHHESVFSEVEKRTNSPWVDIFEDSFIEKEFDDNDFDSVETISSDDSSVDSIVSAYNDSSFFGDNDENEDNDEKVVETAESVSEKSAVSEKSTTLDENTEINDETENANAESESPKRVFEDVYSHPLKEAPSVPEGIYETTTSQHTGEVTPKVMPTAENTYTEEQANHYQPSSNTGGPVNYQPTSKTADAPVDFQQAVNTEKTTDYNSPVSNVTPEQAHSANEQPFVQNNADWKNGSTVKMFRNALKRSVSNNNNGNNN